MMSIALAQAGSTSQEPITIRRMMIPLIRPVLLMRLRCRCWRYRDDLHLVAVGEVDRRLQDNLVSVLDAGVDLDLCAIIRRDRNLVQMGDAVFDNRDLHAVLIEDDRRGGNDQRRRLAGIFSSTVQ